MKLRKSSQNTVKTFITLWIGLLAFTLAGSANATFIDLSGTVMSGGVSNPTPVGPFSTGDMLSGYIEIDDAAVMPGASFDESNLLDFNVSIGLVTFSLADSMPFGFFSGMFSSDTNVLTELNVTTNFGSFAGCSFCNLTLNGAANSFVVSSLTPLGFAEGNLMVAVRDDSVTVPEPTTTLLFSLGLLGLGVTRWSRAKG